jgi:hypothetical protein
MTPLMNGTKWASQAYSSAAASRCREVSDPDGLHLTWMLSHEKARTTALEWAADRASFFWIIPHERRV